MATDIQAKPPVTIATTAPAAAPKAAPESAGGRYLNVTSAQLAKWVAWLRTNLSNPHREKDGVSFIPVAERSAAASQTSVPQLKITSLGNINGASQITPQRPDIECLNPLGLIKLCRQAGVTDV